jgi:hypothetical protein
LSLGLIPAANRSAANFSEILSSAADCIALMPYFFELDPAHRILRCRVEGPVSDDLLRELYALVAEHADSASPRAGIMDFSGVSGLDVSPDTIRELALLPPAIPDMSLPRVVIAAAPKIFGMARMFELEGQVTRPNLHVVRSMEAACAILGVTELQFEPIETAR